MEHGPRSLYNCKRVFVGIFNPWSVCRGQRLPSRAYRAPAAPPIPFFFTQNHRWPGTVNQAAKRQDLHFPDQPLCQAVTGAGSYRRVDALTPRHLIKLYGQLSKYKLTVLVVLTAMSGVALSPLSATVPTLLFTALGTTLCSASASAFNHIQEMPFDAQMSRTRTRPLVRRAITPLHATAFALVTGTAGPAVLWTMVNPTTALLGLGNMMLYAGPYTWLKRRSTVNTAVGAVVGAVPPLMGWTACSGSLLGPSLSQMDFRTLCADPISTIIGSGVSVDGSLAPFALFIFLFSWQFPHFNSLSHILRGSYAQAGFHMLSAISPKQNSLVALRHALFMVPVCSILIPFSGLTTWGFALTALVPNTICARAAWRFWKQGGEKEARALWHICLWHMPVILGLMMVHKQTMELSA